MTIRDLWAAGRCPCCGCFPAASEGTYGGQPKAIGEGVIMCGRCIENEHGRESDQFIPTMLRCIVLGDDAPMDELIKSVRP